MDFNYIENIESWIGKNTYQEESYSDIERLCNLKNQKGYSLSVVFPTLEEDATIGTTLNLVIEKLIKEYNLIDELVVIDGGSKDNTKEECNKYSDYIKFVMQESIIQEHPRSATLLDSWRNN